MSRLGMLIDLSRCIGCDACTIACKAENTTPKGVLFARVLEKELPRSPKNKRVFIPILCNHCADPPCLKSCPTRAISKRPDGIVLVNPDKCSGEGTCVGACPYGAMFIPDESSGYSGNDINPFEKFRESVQDSNGKAGGTTAMKCTFCYHRVDRGLEPACVVTCPVQCRIFGDLDDPNSKPSQYISKKGISPLPLLPSANTKPNVLYFSK
ncbi:MAG: 4Fe-4S dicluster domain-containing protein [Thaumarchaeota archaeon]|nr:4Fe-4S dicluster domain-containing protein [Nitrososphaerota archaeon]